MTDTAGLFGGQAARSPGWRCPWWAAGSGESRGEQAQGLVLVGRQRGAVAAVEVSGDAAAGGARAVTERLYASLSLKLKTFQSHVPLCGDVFYCYFTGCVCIKNKIFLK